MSIKSISPNGRPRVTADTWLSSVDRRHGGDQHGMDWGALGCAKTPPDRRLEMLQAPQPLPPSCTTNQAGISTPYVHYIRKGLIIQQCPPALLLRMARHAHPQQSSPLSNSSLLTHKEQATQQSRRDVPQTRHTALCPTPESTRTATPKKTCQNKAPKESAPQKVEPRSRHDDSGRLRGSR